MTTKKGELVKADAAYPVLASGQRVATMLRESLNGEQLSLSDLDRIKIPAGGGTVWSVGEEPAKALRGIILHHNLVRAYWSQPYGSGETQPPDCFSKDAITGVGTPGGDCFRCPYSEYGSKIGTGGDAQRGQACQQRRLLFLLMEGEYLPRVVSVPPTSLKESKKYLVGLGGQGLSPARVITEITLSGTKNVGGIPYAKMGFRVVGRLDEATAEKAASFGKHIKALMGDASSSDLLSDRDDGDESGEG